MKIKTMQFKTEAQRMQHPEVSLIPSVLWEDFWLFSNKIAAFQIQLMQTPTAYLDHQLSHVEPQYLKTKDKITTWLAIAFSHPTITDTSHMSLFDKLNFKPTEQILLAAYFGRLSLFEKIINNNTDKIQSLITAGNYGAFARAAAGGHLAILEKLDELAPEQMPAMIKARDDAFYKAAKHGHLAVIEKLAELAPDQVLNMITASHDGTTYEAFRNAAEGGHPAIMKWLISKLTELAPKQVPAMIAAKDNKGDSAPFRNAAKGGHLAVIKKIAELAPKRILAMIESGNYGAFLNAAANGHTVVVEWLVNKLAELAPQQVPVMITTKDPEDYYGDHYAAFRNAALGGHLTGVSNILSVNSNLSHSASD